MRKHPSKHSSVSRGLRERSRLETRSKRGRLLLLESLETRRLLSYTFSNYTSGASGTATVTETGGSDSFTVANNGSGLLAWSSNGGATFSTQWGSLPADTLSATSPTVAVTITLGANNSAIIDGTSTTAASSVVAALTVNAFGGNTSDSLTVDDAASLLGGGTYTYSGSAGTITGPLSDINITEGEPSFGGGTTIEGNNAANTYTVTSTKVVSSIGEPITISGGTGNDTANVELTSVGAGVDVDLTTGTNIVNIGQGDSASGILAPVTVTGSATLNINDSDDTVAPTTATLNDSSGNVNAEYQVVGVAAAAILYGPGVTALNINSGNNEGELVDFDINDTQTGTTTTITGADDGATLNNFDLGNLAISGGLSNLLGAVSVIGGTIGTDTATLQDRAASTTDNYVVTSTTVTRGSSFAGLTYAGIVTLTLDAENSNNTIAVNSTANNVVTNINGDNGADTINIASTGTGASVNVTTGVSAGSTVSVVADAEPVNITLGGTGLDAVNVGSTGSQGTMAGILGAIGITDPDGHYGLTFHDENDTTLHTWQFEATTVGLDGGISTTTYDAQMNDLTVDGGSAGDTFNVGNTPANATTNLNTGSGNDSVNVFFTQDSTLNIDGQAGTNTVTLGSGTGPLGMQGLSGTINVNDSSAQSTSLVMDDSEDTVGQAADLNNDGTTGTVTGISPATITYSDSGVSAVALNAGSGSNTFVVNGTVPLALTTIQTGSGANAVSVLATTAGPGLIIVGNGGPNSVTIGNEGRVSGIAGPIDVEEAPASTTLTIDSSNDTFGNVLDLSSSSSESTITGLANLANNTLTYFTSGLSTLVIDTNGVYNQTLNLDFSGGNNPIPVNSTAGLVYNAGALVDGGTHVLNITGELSNGPFTSEIHNAGDPSVSPQTSNYGSIQFTESNDDNGPNNVQTSSLTQTSLNYTGLSPVNDSAPAQVYTFNDLGYPDQSFTATSGTLPGAVPAIVFTSTPSLFLPENFETTTIANKAAVIFNTPAPTSGAAGSGLFGLVNIPTASAGLTSIEFNTDTAAGNKVVFQATPADAETLLTGGTAQDTTIVTGLGVPIDSGMLLDGGPGNDTLIYDADGQIPIIEPTGPSYGALVIGIPDGSSLVALDYQQVNIIDTLPTVPIVTGSAFHAIAGVPDVNVVAGTFTFPISNFFADGAAVPANLPASDFTASIDWGDESSSTGTITLDPDGTYQITGTHTYGTQNSYQVGVTVTYIGGSVPGVVNNTPVSFTLPAETAGPDVPATATVVNAPIAVSALPIVGTEGLPIAAAPIATFIATNPTLPVGDYSASIAITNAAGVTLTYTPVSITEFGTSGQFTVNAPTITLPDEGTYQVRVSVTDSSGVTPVTISGASQALIADAPLTPQVTEALFLHTGVSVSAGTVGSFTDADPTSPIADFSSTIAWGDGTTTAGTISQPGGVGTPFVVAGTHTYARPGTYATTVFVTDVGGSTATLTGIANVADLPVSGATASFTATEGIDTGLFVLAMYTDPNTLATVGDENATLAIGGWGDGTPATAGVTLVVQQVGVTPLTSATNPGAPIFEVLGHHIYTQETTPGLPDTLSVIVITLGGATTTLTSPPGGGVTVLDARLTSSNGTLITGTEGVSTGSVLVGNFTDADPTSTVSDFTALIAWGDGSSSAGTVTETNGVGTPFLVHGTHTYALVGTYATTVTVNDAGGQVTVMSGSAVIADTPIIAASPQPTVSTIEAVFYPVPVYAPPLFNGAVATFTDADASAIPSDFTASISWGDGTPNTAGTVSLPADSSTFVVSGSHTYAFAGTGTYQIQVFLADDAGAKLTVVNTATVTATIPFVVSGILNPSSDTGLSNTDDVTNVTHPNFYGSTTKPDSTITLFATPASGGTPFTIGQAQADGSGHWSITSNLLAPGTYTITAKAVDQFGITSTGPAVITSSLVIDPVAPIIDNLSFDRFDGTLTVTYQDGLSGLDLASVANSAFYHMSAKPIKTNFKPPKLMLPTSISYTPGATPTAPVVVNVVFNEGVLMRGGNYEVIVNSGTGDTGIQDVAGNALDGEFYGQFPTGDGLPGGDFVATVVTHDKLIYPLVPIKDGYVPPSAAVDPPAGSAHKTVTHAVVNDRVHPTSNAVSVAAHRTRVHDHAISAITTEHKKRRLFS